MPRTAAAAAAVPPPHALPLIGPDCRELFLPLPAGTSNPTAKSSRTAAPAHPLLRAGVQMAGLSRLSPPYRINRPWQTMHLLLCTLRGEGRFQINGVRGTFSPGAAWLITEGQPVYYEIAGRGWDFFWFHLYPHHYQLAPANATILDVFPGHLPTLMQGYAEECRRGDSEVANAYAEILAVTLQRLLAPGTGHYAPLPGDDAFSLISGDALASAEPLGGLTELWQRVEANAGKGWTVTKLAEEVHCSAPHLHRLCLRHYGHTPMEVVGRIRMRLAQRRLSLPETKLESLAAELGYATAFSFSRAFKKFCGMPPAEFRRRRQTC